MKKKWGIKIPVFTSQTANVDLLIIEPRGFCSKHKHFQKHNLFYVISGELLVQVQLKDRIAEHILTAGKQLLIKSGYFHQFIANTEVMCIEVAFVTLSEDDIYRLDEGGIKLQEPTP